LVKLVFSAIRISRPFNILIGMSSVFVAIIISGTLHPFTNVLLAIFSYGALIHAGANTINDYFDVEIDRINKPDRPIPAGDLSRELAYKLALIEFFLGIILAVFINQIAFLLALLFSVLIYLYSYKFKKIAILGNLIVSLASASAFICGGAAVDRINETLIPAGFAFFYHFGREIIKDIQDLKGDIAQNARTFPVLYGIKASLYLITTSYMILIFLTILPFVLNIYSYHYFLILLLGVYPVIIFSIIRIWKSQTSSDLGKISNILKANMVVGLLAIYLG
jgi:geranylgeranylglycerol-phosphate geranylgeranyltransferase